MGVFLCSEHPRHQQQGSKNIGTGKQVAATAVGDLKPRRSLALWLPTPNNLHHSIRTHRRIYRNFFQWGWTGENRGGRGGGEQEVCDGGDEDGEKENLNTRKRREGENDMEEEG